MSKRVERNSSFECLRLICIFGIVCMHVFGTYKEDVVGTNLIFGVFINTLFNAGVSCFALISGYFGVKFSIRKITSLEFRTLFYSLASFVLLIICGTEHYSIGNLLEAMTPIYSRKYWYISAYMMLILFADFVNGTYELKSRSQKDKLLILLLIVFSCIPTFINKDIMGDGGKGFFNILLMYFLGRYIREYKICKEMKWRKIAGWTSFSFGVGMALNFFTTFIKGNVGVSAPFSRDCSLTIILLSCCIFLLFSRVRFHSAFINNIARHTLTIYLFEGAIRKVLLEKYHLQTYISSCYLPLLVVTESILICVICIFVGELYELSFGRVENWVSVRLENLNSKRVKE